MIVFLVAGICLVLNSRLPRRARRQARRCDCPLQPTSSVHLDQHSIPLSPTSSPTVFQFNHPPPLFLSPHRGFFLVVLPRWEKIPHPIRRSALLYTSCNNFYTSWCSFPELAARVSQPNLHDSTTIASHGQKVKTEAKTPLTVFLFPNSISKIRLIRIRGHDPMNCLPADQSTNESTAYSPFNLLTDWIVYFPYTMHYTYSGHLK